ncbi:hypothetical protein Tco_1578792 [Tanacetum coccineum]
MVQPYMPLGPVHDMKKVKREEEHDFDIPSRDGVMQPLTPQTVHVTPPDDDYVASVTNPILDKQLNEFGKEFSDMTEVDENGKYFKSILVGYHADDDDGLELWMLLMEADLEHGLENVVSSSSSAMLRGVFCSNSTLIFDFSFP